jgi:hypothetical protein
MASTVTVLNGQHDPSARNPLSGMTGKWLGMAITMRMSFDDIVMQAAFVAFTAICMNSALCEDPPPLIYRTT